VEDETLAETSLFLKPKAKADVPVVRLAVARRSADDVENFMIAMMTKDGI